MFNFLDENLNPISSIGKDVWCPPGGKKGAGKGGALSQDIPAGFYASAEEAKVVRDMGGLKGVMTEGRKSAKDETTGKVEGPQVFLITAEKLYEFQTRVEREMSTTTQHGSNTVYQLPIASKPGTLQYGAGGMFNNLPLVDGLTLATGPARSGKTTLLDSIARTMVHAFNEGDSNHVPVYMSWGEPEPEALTDYRQFIQACNLAFLASAIEKKKLVLFVDSFKMLAHMGGGLAKEGISRNMFAWVTALSGLLARASTPMFATFNPQAESLKGLYQSIEASVSTHVTCNSVTSMVFSTRIPVKGGPATRSETKIEWTPPKVDLTSSTKFSLPGNFQAKFMPWSSVDLDLFGNKGKGKK